MSFFYYTFGLFMMTEKRLSTDFAMHNHLRTAKTQHQCFHSHRTPCCNPSDYENNLWIWRTLFCRVTHLTSILFFFFFYIFIPLIWSGSPMKYEPVTHKSTQDGGGWFPNLCSWNANSLTMYRRFTVTAQRHTEKEGGKQTGKCFSSVARTGWIQPHS